MEYKKEIFKAYDIRGVYPEEINEEVIQKVALAYLNLLSKKCRKPANELKVAVGRDNRLSSEPLAKEVIQTFLKYGVRVIDLDLVSVNDIYFAVGHYQFDGGLMITASHNPPEYGGCKMVIFNYGDNTINFVSGQEIYGELKVFNPDSFQLASGDLVKKDIRDDHLKHILSFVDFGKIQSFKIVVDTGNGMNGLLVPKIFETIKVDFIPLFQELDGKFPNRPPNPLSEGASDKAGNKIKETSSDFGIIFDVDGDRMFLIDEKGQLIRGDMVLLLLAKSILAKQPGAGIAYNLICSKAVPELITKWGGRPIRSEVGYRHLARHMKEKNGLMSGEVSGHFAFKDNYYADSSFIAMVLALETISTDGRKLSEIIKDYQLYKRGDEINLQVDNIETKLAIIRNSYRNNIKDEIDGITVEFSDWWFNIRPSNTEPLLRITVEAQSKAALKKHQQEILDIINHK